MMIRRALVAHTFGVLTAIGVVSACGEDAATPGDSSHADDGGAFVCPEVASSDIGVPNRPLRVVMLTTETLYHHDDAHAVGDKAVPEYLRARGHQVVLLKDPALLNAELLAQTDVLFYFVTSGDVVTSLDTRSAIVDFVHAGKGIVGTHTALVTDWAWPFFVELMGVRFLGHGMGDQQITDASVLPSDASSLTSFLPSPWIRSDEWYYYADDFQARPQLVPVLLLDETTLPPQYPDAGRYAPAPHPLSWTQKYECGRVFVSSLGHLGSAYTDETFLRSLAVGVEWAGAPASLAP